MASFESRVYRVGGDRGACYSIFAKVEVHLKSVASVGSAPRNFEKKQFVFRCLRRGLNPSTGIDVAMIFFGWAHYCLSPIYCCIAAAVEVGHYCLGQISAADFTRKRLPGQLD